jgi:Ca-activated chloride channel family protein
MQLYAALALSPLLLFSTALRGQSSSALDSSQQPISTLQVKTRVVEISAVVTSKSGNPAGGLTKDDFVLKEDGKEMPIRYFSQGSDLPLTLALLIDTSASQRTFVGDESQAGTVFVDTVLSRKDDQATLVQFDTNVAQLTGLTHSQSRLQLALSLLGSAAPQAATSPIGASRQSGGTLLYDAIYATAKNVLASHTGRKAIVILTDGCDFGSRYTLNQAIEQAQRADTQVYSILYTNFTGVPGKNSYQCSTSSSSAFGDPGLSVLQKISETTGGHVFSVAQNLSLREIFAQISQRLRLEYELAYTPSAEIQPDTYHKLDVRLKTKGLVVQARKGFFAQP